MTFITSDTHRDFRKIESFCTLFGTTKNDLIIILGDAGINYYGGEQDNRMKFVLAELPITLLCIHGNHEQRPESLGIYHEMEWRGGVVYIEPEYDNLLFAKDGEIFDLDGMKCIVICGAYSVDKEYRLAYNRGWWADEQPSDEIKQRVENRLDEAGWRVDVVLSHTAPLKYEPREVFLRYIDDSKVDKSTEIWLDNIEDRLDYRKWFCGHYHTDKTIDKLRLLYKGLLEFR